MTRLVRELVALLLMATGTVLGLIGMLKGEAMMHVSETLLGTPQGIQQMLQGLEVYCSAIGLLFFLVGVAFIMVGRDELNDDITTILVVEDNKTK